MTRGGSRALIAWGSTLVLAVAGSQIGHALAYRLVTPDHHDRAQLLAETGHHYLGYWRLVLALGIGVLVAVVVAEAHAARRRSGAHAPAWRFAVVGLVAFVAQEHLERLAHDGVFPWTAACERTFLVGLVLQLPFALAAYLAARLLLSAARAIGLRLGEAPRRRPFVVRVGRPRLEVRAERLAALALGYGERGPPPVANDSAPEPQVARTWKRGAIATRRRTVARRTGLIALAATLVALFVAPAALAHAVRVTLRFNEPVAEFASVCLHDGSASA